MIVTIWCYQYSQKEGVEKWPSGKPIQLVSLDYDNRVTEFGPVIEPSNDIEADMKLIQDYFKDVRAKRPDQFGGEYL